MLRPCGPPDSRPAVRFRVWRVFRTSGWLPTPGFRRLSVTLSLGSRMGNHTRAGPRHISSAFLLVLSLVFSVYRCLAPGPTWSVWLSDIVLSSVGLAILMLLLGIVSFVRHRRRYSLGARFLNCALACVSAALLLCVVIPATRPRSTTRPDYVSSALKFRREGSWFLLPGQRKALAAARSELEREFGAQVEGTFSVARSRTGYQVDFHDLQVKVTQAGWQDVEEGFGEVFLTKDHRIAQTCIGP